MTSLVLDPKQEAAVTRMLNEPTRAVLNASEGGAGKSEMAIALGMRLQAATKLIMAPKTTLPSWEERILRYDGKVARRIDSTVKGKKALDDLIAGVEGWYTMSRDLINSKYFSERLTTLKKPIDYWVFDEIAKFSNRKSAGFRVLKNIKAGFKHFMSATPYGNKFGNMWTLARILWPNLTPASFWKWVAEWAIVKEDIFSGTVVVGEKQPGAFANSLPCYVRIPSHWEGKTPPLHDKIVVKLSAQERRIYDEFNKNLVVFLKENPLVTSIPSTKSIRLKQMTQGTIDVRYLDDGTEEVYYPEDMKSSKLEALQEFIQDNPDEPLLIVTQFAKYAEVVAKRLGDQAALWTGSVSAEKREQARQDFMSGKINYIVAQIAAIGEGVDGLQHRCNTLCWLDRAEGNEALNEQVLWRLHRRGQTRRVRSINFIAEDTYDQGILNKSVEQRLTMNQTLTIEGNKLYNG